MSRVWNKIAGWGVLEGLLLFGLLVTGCRTQQPTAAFAEIPGIAETAPVGDGAVPSTPGAAVQPAAADVQTLPPGVLQAGDAIIVVYNDLPIIVPQFEGEIKADGTITLIQNQTFKAEGKTVGQLETEIRERYVPNIFKTMTATVRLKEERRFYYVGGEVKAPGRQMYLGRITVVKAVQSAGDFTDFARRTRVKLTRANGKQIIVDCKEAIENPAKDVDVFPGDTIHVPRRFF